MYLSVHRTIFRGQAQRSYEDRSSEMSERLLGALRWPLRGLLDHVLRGPPSMAQTKQQKRTRDVRVSPLSAFGQPRGRMRRGGRFAFSWESWEWADVKFLEERGYFG